MAGWTIRAATGAGVITLAACAGAQSNDTNSTDPVTLANPAAVFCTESGGTYEIRDGADGQVGICTLPDGTEIDAWDYFREKNGG